MRAWQIALIASLGGLVSIAETVGQSPTVNREVTASQTNTAQTNTAQTNPTQTSLEVPEAALGEEQVAWFESKIRPLLVRRCYECHSAESGKTHGSLALDTKAGWEKGGDSGAAIVPGDLQSLMILAVEYASDGPQMPPENAGGKLPESEIELLKQWVVGGAIDPRTELVRRGGLTDAEMRSWWSFQPIVSPAIESQTQPLTTTSEIAELPAASTVDDFVRQRLTAAKIEPAEEADRRTLIRRATYDLTGLPPTPDEVDAFVNDLSPTAYSQLIERLLESPRYGERWGRHWLDVIRYADTAGENTDHPIQDAWRFRNWVIDALNQDMPYDRFVREQIAGDLMHAGDPPEQLANGIVATGFLAIARRFDHDSDKHMHLTYEDTIDTLGRAVLGLSIACARCHDHKYDPISAEDYYALYGILASTRFSFPGCEAKQQPRDLVPLMSQEQWSAAIEPHARRLAEVEAQLAQLQLGPLFDDTQSTFVTLAEGEVFEGGEFRFDSESNLALETVRVQPGELLRLTVDPNGNYGADTTLIELKITSIAGDNPQSWDLTTDALRSFLTANPLQDRYNNAGVWWLLDGRGSYSMLGELVGELSGQSALKAWRSGDNPAVFVNTAMEPVRVWTTLPAQSLFVHPAADGAVAIGWMSPMAGEVRVSGRVVDAHPGGPNGVLCRLEHSAVDYRAKADQLSNVAAQRPALLERRATLVASTPTQPHAYAVAEQTPSNARLHQRGDPEQLGPEVPRRWLQLFGGERLPEQSGSGRLELARWLTIDNPLTARVMVNRIWLQHFGNGLVATPNDFGTRGELPSHPELLDWLATEFKRSGWSVKAMHRLIMNSETYRRSNLLTTPARQQHALEVDPNNRLLWRFDRRRLSAEELRDTLLVASDQLDLSPGAEHPIAPPETWSFTQHVPFTGVPETNQRSVYLITLRNRRQPFFGLFDGADPNASTPQRQVTTVPTQALYFMNDPFVHAQAEQLIERVQVSAEEDRLNGLYRIVFQRQPTAQEQMAAKSFMARYRQSIDLASPADSTQPETTASLLAERELAVWQAYARVVLSSNEFLYVD